MKYRAGASSATQVSGAVGATIAPLVSAQIWCAGMPFWSSASAHEPIRCTAEVEMAREVHFCAL